MPIYRIYDRNASGRISAPPHVVSGEHDSAAIFAANERHRTNDQEVWQDTRLVAVVKPNAKCGHPKTWRNLWGNWHQGLRSAGQ